MACCSCRADWCGSSGYLHGVPKRMHSGTGAKGARKDGDRSERPDSTNIRRRRGGFGAAHPPVICAFDWKTKMNDQTIRDLAIRSGIVWQDDTGFILACDPQREADDPHVKIYRWHRGSFTDTWAKFSTIPSAELPRQSWHWFSCRPKASTVFIPVKPPLATSFRIANPDRRNPDTEVSDRWQRLAGKPMPWA